MEILVVFKTHLDLGYTDLAANIEKKYIENYIPHALDLAEKMIRLAGLEPYKDIDIMEIGLRPGEKMFEELRLDGEDTERTKNDLIFVNHVMRITRAEIDEKLDELARMIADKVPEPQLKQRLLEMIHDHEKQAENA